MGLLDILNGMQNGPRGPSEPTQSGESGGMSPITMAILQAHPELAGLKLTGHFLERDAFGARHRPLPEARFRLAERIAALIAD